MSYIEAITLTIAVLGAVLGIINTWRNIDVSRVKLMIRPAHAFPVGGTSPLNYCIEVSNRSSFAITVSEVGFLVNSSKKRMVIYPATFDGKGFPTRLESRESVSYYFTFPSCPPRYIKKAFAKTACGTTKTGLSGSLKQIAREPPE